MTIISTTVGKNPLENNGVAFLVNKSLKSSVWVQPQKWQNDLSTFPRQTMRHHSNPSLCLNHWGQRSWSWLILWRPTTPSRNNTRKDVLFIIVDWNAKVGNQDSWNNRHVWPWNAKWSRPKANTVWSKEHGLFVQSKHLFPATQGMTLPGHQ